MLNAFNQYVRINVWSMGYWGWDVSIIVQKNVLLTMLFKIQGINENIYKSIRSSCFKQSNVMIRIYYVICLLTIMFVRVFSKVYFNSIVFTLHRYAFILAGLDQWFPTGGQWTRLKWSSMLKFFLYDY